MNLYDELYPTEKENKFDIEKEKYSGKVLRMILGSLAAMFPYLAILLLPQILDFLEEIVFVSLIVLFFMMPLILFSRPIIRKVSKLLVVPCVIFGVVLGIVSFSLISIGIDDIEIWFVCMFPIVSAIFGVTAGIFLRIAKYGKEKYKKISIAAAVVTYAVPVLIILYYYVIITSW